MRRNSLCMVLCLSTLILLVSGCGRETAVEPIQSGPAPAASQAAISTPEAPVESPVSQQEQPPAFLYTFDPHVISREYLEVYGPEIEGEFYAFCDAVLAGEDTFPCPSAERCHRLLSIARTCLPIADTLVEQDAVFAENGVGHIVYKVAQSELLDQVRLFREKVTSVITDAIPYAEDDFIKALELLTAVARKDALDEENTLDDILKVTPYRAIMEDTGICQELAGEYIYYLLQVGIDAFPCSALNRDGSEAHEWAMAELDGEYYHMDPTYTASYPDSLFFFGMNDLQREYYGDYPPENFSYSDTDALDSAKYRAESRRFEPLWLAESYTIDHRAGKIILKAIASNEETEFQFASE